VFKNVIFDMDGLMIDSELLMFEVFRDYLSQTEPPLTMDFFQHVIGKSTAEGNVLLENRYPGVAFDEAVLLDMYTRCIDEGRLKIKPGLYELLDTLDRLGVKKSIASSNILEIIELCLAPLGLLERFDFIVCDGMVEKCKPAPDLHLEAARLMGAKPEDCLILEDSEPGVCAGLAAGGKVIAIPDIIPIPERYAKKCYAVLDSLHDVNKLFADSLQ